MRVAHLVDVLNWGGAQRLLLTFVETARHYEDIETTIVGLKLGGIRSTLPELLQANGAKVIVLSTRKLYDPQAAPSLARLFKKERVDIVQTHLSHSNILGSFAAKLARIPAVGTLHTTQLPLQRAFSVSRVLEHYCLRNCATRVVAVGQNVARTYNAMGGNKNLDIIPNAVPPAISITQSEREAIRAELAGDPERPLFLAVGRLTEPKCYIDMLEAFHQVRTCHPNAFLMIVGHGQLRNALETHAQSLNLADSVRFAGSRDDVPYILSACDIFVNSSVREGLSVAILEAMAAGLPVVATRVGEAETMLAGGRGILADVHDIDAISKGMIRLLENPESRTTMGDAARQYVHENYATKPWFEKLLQTYAKARLEQ
jgi:glycosyltransferase involved in cell wall biosynthesis